MAVCLLDIVGCYQNKIQFQLCLVYRRCVRSCCDNSFPGLKRCFRLFHGHPRRGFQKLDFSRLYFCSRIPGEIAHSFRVISSQGNCNLIRQHAILHAEVRMELSVISKGNRFAIYHVVQAVIIGGKAVDHIDRKAAYAGEEAVA